MAEDERSDEGVEDVADANDVPEPRKELKKVKKKKPGIVYLPNFPPFMTITKAKEILGQFGEIGRTYFEPKQSKSAKDKSKKAKPSVHFSEGWIEFKSKTVAKEVARCMNNTIVGGKRKSKYYDCLWSIKYLPGFKWIHLNERLAYERAVRKHKLRIEVAQAKKEANIFAANVEKSKKSGKMNENPNLNNEYIQRQTESEIVSSRTESEEKTKTERREFLKSLFNS